MHNETTKVNGDITTDYSDFTADYVKEIAAQRNYEYVSQATSSSTSPSLYNNDRLHAKELHKISFMIDGLKCEYYTTQYRSLSQTNNTDYQVQVFAVTLPFNVEDLYVESKTNITLGNIFGLSLMTFSNAQKIQLEGEFNDFFRVYTPQKEALNAFTILAPNIMLRLMKDAANYDFEFSGNKVYFYQTFGYYVKDKITINKNRYDSLLAFGIVAARDMARAGRPAQLADGPNTTMWQLGDRRPSAPTILLILALFFIGGTVGLPFLIIFVIMRYKKLKQKQELLRQRFDTQMKKIA